MLCDKIIIKTVKIKFSQRFDYQSSWIFSMEFKNKFLPTYYSSHSVMTLPWCIIVDHVLIFYIAIKLFVTLIPAMEIKVCQQNEERACTCVLSPVWCFAGPWIIAHQALLSIEFSRQEYCSGLPFPNSRGTSPPRDWTCISCIGKWILYCCAKSKPISPVLAITRSQLPSLDLAKIKGRQEVRKLYSEKKREGFTKIGGCWNNGKCHLSPAPELKARGKTLNLAATDQVLNVLSTLLQKLWFGFLGS